MESAAGRAISGPRAPRRLRQQRLAARERRGNCKDRRQQEQSESAAETAKAGASKDGAGAPRRLPKPPHEQPAATERTAGNPLGTAQKKMFEAHMDSVAPTTGTKVVRKDGVLYSDGTTTLGGDDKVGIAASLEAVKVILENKLPHGDIQLCFTIGEEIGSIGVRYMDPSWIKADIGYCLDEGFEPGLVNNAAPRAVKLFVKVIGKAAHAGVEPEKGINAIMLAAKALTALPAYGRLDEETTLSVGKIEGGLASNIVAPSAEFVIDMRCLNPEKLDVLINDTKKTLTEAVEADGGQIEINVEEGSPAMRISEDDLGVVFVKEATKKLGLPFKLFSSGGCTDGNYLCGMGLPCVALSTGMDKIHSTEECLKEKDLYNLARLVLEIISAAAKKQ